LPPGAGFAIAVDASPPSVVGVESDVARESLDAESVDARVSPPIASLVVPESSAPVASEEPEEQPASKSANEVESARERSMAFMLAASVPRETTEILGETCV